MRVLVLTPWIHNPAELDVSPASTVRDVIAFVVAELEGDPACAYQIQDADEGRPFPRDVSLAQCDVCDGDMLELVSFAGVHRRRGEL